MAIEDYTGVTKVDDYLYEVTAEVTLDAQNLESLGESFAIGNISDSTFIIKSGGFLRFCSGDSATEPYTTFTNCTFIYTSTAFEITGDTYYRGPGYGTDTISNAGIFYSPGRFRFVGCEWLQDTQTKFDMRSATNYYQFVQTPQGKYCRLYADPTEQPSTVHNMYWGEGTVDGLFFDISGQALLNPQINKNNILIADKDPGNYASANFSSQISTYDPQYVMSHLFYRGIQARAVYLPQTPFYHWWYTATEGQTVFSGTADTVKGTTGALAIGTAHVNKTLYQLNGGWEYLGATADYITNTDWDQIDPVTGFTIDDVVFDTDRWKSWWRVFVYKNDVLLEETTDYTFDATSVTLTSGATLGDDIHIKIDARFRPDLRTINLVDPVGRTVKVADVDYAYSVGGTLKLWRTLSGEFVDISTKASIPSVRTVITRDSTSKLELDQTASSFSVELNYTESLMEFTSITEDGDYTAKFLAYGYDLQERGITIEDTTDVNGYDQGSILLFQDSNVTQRTEATVAAYTEVNTTPEIYDYFKHWEMTRPYTEVGSPFVTISAAGDTVDFGDKDVYFGQYGTGSVINYFDSDYTTPPGKTPGDVESGGLVDQAATANSTGSYTRAHTDFPGWATYARLRIGGMEINDDGTTMIIHQSAQYDCTGAWLTQLSLSTPWDVSTATVVTTVQFSTNVNLDGTDWSMSMSRDGTKVSLTRNSQNANNCMVVTLGTAWDLTGTVTPSAMGSNSSLQHYFYWHSWADDGSTLICTNEFGTSIRSRWHTCSTPYDPSTAGTSTYYSSTGFGTGGNDTYLTYTTPMVYFNDGLSVFVMDPSNATYKIVDVATAYNWPSDAEFNAATEYSFAGASAGQYGSYRLVGTHIVATESGFKNSTGTHTFNLASWDLETLFELYGAPNSFFIESGASISDGASDFTIMKTTGYFYEQGTTSINTQTQDATGVGTTVTIKGINPNTEVRMYRASDDVEIAGVENSIGTQATLAYNFVNPENMYIVIHNVGYITSPRYIEFTTQATAATLTVFQSIDRTYRNP